MADIGAKIQIDGEKQFRNDLKNLTQAGKTLSAQMDTLSSSFNTANNKEEVLGKAADNLNSQIKNQQKIVDKLSDAVAKSAQEKGEDATETLKLKEQLAKAETTLNKMKGTTAESAVGMNDLAESENKAGREASAADGNIGAMAVALGNLISDAIKEGFNFMVESLKNIVKFFADATKGAAEYADEILTLSSETNMSTDALQEYKYMAALVDTDLSTITGSMTKLTKSMSSARDGTGATADAFKQLNISVTDSEGNLRSANDVFDEAITALGGIENDAERDAAAMVIFGKSAKDLNPLIKAGGDALSGFRQEAHDVGYVMSGETLDAMSEVQDGFDRLGLAADSAKNQIGAAIGKFMLPYLNELVGAVQTLLKDGDVNKFVKTISTSINNLVKDLANALPTILKAGTEIVEQLIMGINEVLPELAPVAVGLISDLAMFLLQNLPTITETALQIILQLMTGLAEQAPTLIPAAVECITQIVIGLVSHIGDIITAAIELIDGLIEGLTSPKSINAIIDAIPQLILGIVNGILNNLDKVIAAGINITVNLTIGIIRAIPQLIAMLPQIFQAVASALRSYDWKSLGRNILSNLSIGVSNAISIVTNAVKNAFNAAVSFIKSLGGQAVSWGRDLVQGFINGITARASALWAKVKELSGGIARFLHFSRPDEGPLRNYEQWMPDFMKGLAAGIDANAWRVQDALRNATGGMTVAGRSTNVDFGGVAINVYAAQNQDANAIARQVMAVMQNEYNAKKAVFA